MFPGVYIAEAPGGIQPISGVNTSETAFVDHFANGPINKATRVESYAEFLQIFGVRDTDGAPDALIALDPRSEASYALEQYFLNGGSVAWVVRVASDHDQQSPEWTDGEGADAILGRGGEGAGIYALRQTGFSILCLPAAAYLSPSSLKVVYDEAMTFCNEEKAFLIVDIPPAVKTAEEMRSWLDTSNPNAIKRDKNGAVYFPRLIVSDQINQVEPRNIGSSGTMAGVYARTDAQRGIWKAPAGTDATLNAVRLASNPTDSENGALNSLGINVLRQFPPVGPVSWGARTLSGADDLGSEWKYIPVRRTALYVERSIHEGTGWTVTEQNDEALWGKVRLNVGAFMQDLFLKGAFQGKSPREGYFVKCDSETMSQNDISLGVLNIVVGFASLKPAEFVIIKIQKVVAHIDP
ncbi:MAG: uncharacterized protein QOJ64_4446 [Acidobacteriota bacterium]|nr:uncharacterized protein [Acidobacteriota bacterium]